MPNLTEYIVDPLLTNMSVGYANNETIAEQLFPSLEVKSRTGIYYKFDKSAFRVEDDLRTGTARANRVDYGMSKQTYGPLLEHSLEEAVEWEVRDTYPTPMDAYADATMNLSKKLALRHEKSVAAILTSTSIITQNTTLSGTAQWSDYANSDPFGDIQAGFDVIQGAALVTPNTAAMGYQVWSKLKNHPDLLGRMSVAAVRTLTEDLFAALIGVEKLLVGKVMENTAKEGQTDTLSYVWGKDFVLCYTTGTPALKSINVGYTLRWGGQRLVDRWTEEGIKSDLVRVTDYYEAKLVAAEAAYLIKNAVA